MQCIERGLKIEGVEIDKGQFLKDLLESVCILQRDGAHYSFSHRSFQEYFAAYALLRIPTRHVGPILTRGAKRPEDDVVTMLFDMNQDLVESEYIVVHLAKLLNKISSFPKSEFLLRSMELQQLILTAIKDRRGESATFDTTYMCLGESDEHYFILTLKRLYMEIFYKGVRSAAIRRRHAGDEKIAGQAFDGMEEHVRKRKAKLLGLRVRAARKEKGELFLECFDRAPQTPAPKSLDWVYRLSLKKSLEEELSALRELGRDIKQRIQAKSDSIDTIFQLD